MCVVICVVMCVLGIYFIESTFFLTRETLMTQTETRGKIEMKYSSKER